MNNKTIIDEVAIAVLPELIRPLAEGWKVNGVDVESVRGSVDAAFYIGKHFDLMRPNNETDNHDSDTDSLDGMRKLFEVSKRAMDVITTKEKSITVGDMFPESVSVMRYMDGYFTAGQIADSLDSDLAAEGLKEFVGIIFDKVLSDEQRKQVTEIVKHELVKEAPTQ